MTIIQEVVYVIQIYYKELDHFFEIHFFNYYFYNAKYISIVI